MKSFNVIRTTVLFHVWGRLRTQRGGTCVKYKVSNSDQWCCCVWVYSTMISDNQHYYIHLYILTIVNITSIIMAAYIITILGVVSNMQRFSECVCVCICVFVFVTCLLAKMLTRSILHTIMVGLSRFYNHSLRHRKFDVVLLHCLDNTNVTSSFWRDSSDLIGTTVICYV